MKRRGAAAIVVALIALSVACGGGGGGVKCSLKNPATIDEGVGQWPKFRRDRLNTGTIVLDATAFDALAREGARELEWSFPPADEAAVGPFVASPAINSAQSVVYVGSGNSRVYALSLADGTRIQSAPTPQTTATPPPTPGPFEVNGDPAVFNSSPVVGRRDDMDAIYIASGGGQLFGVDEHSEAMLKIWPASLDAYVAAATAIGSDGTLYVSTLGPSGMSAICPNGAPRFATAYGPGESAAAIGVDPDKKLNGTVYFGADDRLIHAIRRDGPTLWTAPTSAPVLAAPIVELNDTATQTAWVYAVDASGQVVKLDNYGRRARDFRFSVPSASNPVVASPALALGRLYVVVDDTVYALDKTTGTQLWSYTAGARIQSSPAVALRLAADSETAPARDVPPVITFGADDGKLYVLRDLGATAALLDAYALPVGDGEPASPLLSSPAVAKDGSIVIGGINGRVYRIR